MAVSLNLICTRIELFVFFCLCFSHELSGQVVFKQGERSYVVAKQSDSIRLYRGAFSLCYFSKAYNSKTEQYYSAQVAVLNNPEDTLALGIGKSVASIPFFEPGTGMAPDKSGFYEAMIVSNQGHHYLIYEYQSDIRVYLVAKNKDDLELEWRISAAFCDGQDYEIKDMPWSILYFSVLIDANLNAIIDEGELKIIKVCFAS